MIPRAPGTVLPARFGGDGGESNSPSRNLRRRPLRACPMLCRRAFGRPSTACRTFQPRTLSGFDSGYATLPGIAPPLNDASTAQGGEAASTLTLLPKQRGREQAGCCQLLRLGSFLRGLETNLGSRSPVTGPCRNHASPRSRRSPAPADCTAAAVVVKLARARTPAGAPLGSVSSGCKGPASLGPGVRRRSPAPPPGASLVRLCRGAGRGAACPGPALSPAWPGRVR